MTLFLVANGAASSVADYLLPTELFRFAQFDAFGFEIVTEVVTNYSPLSATGEHFDWPFNRC